MSGYTYEQLAGLPTLSNVDGSELKIDTGLTGRLRVWLLGTPRHPLVQEERWVPDETALGRGRWVWEEPYDIEPAAPVDEDDEPDDEPDDAPGTDDDTQGAR